MQIDDALVRSIARLARLKVEEEQVGAVGRELTSIIGWVEQLQSIDTENVPPLTGMASQRMALRPDEVNDGDCAAVIVKNAPLAEDDFFVVPKVLE
ncbi:MAG: Asp-tRNA(Asn)/Glu-tRNA(Gln) amidotransferase subunit GatC [Hyphomicrobiales bacterium]|nr:Asp-tRNA(Asn)/Glu-tRNA(Gln) amidotransferase subunit GatC [Hyphomicrobiales bacterium]